MTHDRKQPEIMDREGEKGKKKRDLGVWEPVSEALRIVIGGGGTGGHLFPGIAIAQEFLDRNPESSILFVGTGRAFEISILAETGFRHQRITAEGLKGRGIWNQIVSISKIPKGVFESIRILKGFKPDLVIGVGGYAAGPLVMGAWFLKIKVVLHEQNILPGITNRILSHFADRIYVSFQETQSGLNPKKVQVTGNPVRKEILQCARGKNKTRVRDSRQKTLFTIFVIGGSQGAHSINTAVLDAINYIENKENFFFIHQTGARDETQVKRTYAQNGIQCEVQAFFRDMGVKYQNADLIICRAGATTVAEIKAVGKGTIFIPFPFAADNHQVLNAQSLVDAGAAEMILEKNLSGKVLAERINAYASRPEVLDRMASRAGDLGGLNAAAVIVDDCYELVKSAHGLKHEGVIGER